MFRKKKESSYIYAVQYGAISNPGILDGRLIPHIIADTSGNPQVEEYIINHEGAKPGDVLSQWGRPTSNSGQIALILDCKGPIDVDFAVIFDISKFSSAIDHIMQASAFYLQSGKQGDKISSSIDRPSIIVEVAASGFEVIWEKRYRSFTRKKMIKEGVKKSSAESAAEARIAHLREIWRRYSLR